MPEPNTPGGSIDPASIPPGITAKFAFIEAAQSDSCEYAWGDDDARQIFGEEGGGYAWISSSGTIPRWVEEDGGYVSCGLEPGSWSPSPSPSPSPGGGGGQGYPGGNAPPPPDNREKDCMCGCDCNDIATMIQRQLAEQAALFEGVKDHIDRRVKEEITIHGKQLEAMNLDLQPMMDRMNQMESNLWNGIKQ